MSRVSNEATIKRNAEIRKLSAQGLTYKEVARRTHVQTTTVHRVLKEVDSNARNNYISKANLKEIRVLTPFRAHLVVGQEVILKSIKLDANKNIVAIRERKYKVVGVYSHHIRFERPGSHGNTIVKDYIWADLRYRLKMKGEVAGC